MVTPPDILAVVTFVEGSNHMELAIDELADYITDNCPEDPVLMNVLQNLVYARVGFKLSSKYGGVMDNTDRADFL